MRRQLPKVGGVNAGEEAREVLVVNLGSWDAVKVCVLEELDEVKDVSFLLDYEARLWVKAGIDEFGDAVQHWSKRCCEETDNWAARAKLFLIFRFGRT